MSEHRLEFGDHGELEDDFDDGEYVERCGCCGEIVTELDLNCPRCGEELE